LPDDQCGAEADAFQVCAESFERGHYVGTEDINRLFRFKESRVVEVLTNVGGSILTDGTEGGGEGGALVGVVEPIELTVGVVTDEAAQ
jgi:hypothetical protein